MINHLWFSWLQNINVCYISVMIVTLIFSKKKKNLISSRSCEPSNRKQILFHLANYIFLVYHLTWRFKPAVLQAKHTGGGGGRSPLQRLQF